VEKPLRKQANPTIPATIIVTVPAISKSTDNSSMDAEMNSISVALARLRLLKQSLMTLKNKPYDIIVQLTKARNRIPRVKSFFGKGIRSVRNGVPPAQ
jgi:hypothetical protein